MNFVIDFSWSIDDWLEVIRKLIVLVEDFFADLGIVLFPSPEEAPSESTEADA